MRIISKFFAILLLFSPECSKGIVINSKSPNQTVLPGRTASMTVVISGVINPSYEWQVDTNSSNIYTKVVDGAMYNGANENVLLIKAATCAMNNYHYRCMVSDKNPPGGGGVLSMSSDYSTLFVNGCVVRTNDTVAFGEIMSISVSAEAQINYYQWQTQINKNSAGNNWKNLTDDAVFSGANLNTLTIHANDLNTDLGSFRCVMRTVMGDTSISNTESVTVSGLISPQENKCALNTDALFSVTPFGMNKTYKWLVNENWPNKTCKCKRKKHDTATFCKCPMNRQETEQNSFPGFRIIDLSTSDSDYYNILGNGTKLKIKKTWAGLNNNVYACRVADTATGAPPYYTDKAFLKLHGPIDPLLFELTAAIYSQPKILSQGNTAALTQTYIRGSIPLTRMAKTGVDINSGFKDRLVPFRNLFIQLTWSTNVENLNYVDSMGKTGNGIANPEKRYVNRLDLYQYANLNLNIMSPVVTWIGGSARRENSCNIYLDPYVSFLHTTVNDSPMSNISVLSVAYGGNLTVRIKPTPSLILELNTRIFGLNPISGSVNPNYNFQYARKNDYDTLSKAKPLAMPARPLFNFDGLLIYNTSPSSPTTANIFIHFSMFSNLVKTQYKDEKNSFFQLQAGIATDVQKLATNLYKVLSGS